MTASSHQVVTDVHHWTDNLFSFRTTRDPAFRFQSGQFTMIGVEVEGRPLLRAYSIASAHYDDELEFFSIKVQDGPLTSRLQHLKMGDPIIVSRKATGTLVHQNLLAGDTFYLLGTGTGLAPFLSIIRDPETYERYGRVILVHGCRKVAELAYGERIRDELPSDEFLGEEISRKLLYYPTVTREPFQNRGRITDPIQSGRLFKEIGKPPLSAETDRLMLCGSPEMILDTKNFLESSGFAEGNHSEPGHFVIEKAFVER